jgi:hypothetical protein
MLLAGGFCAVAAGPGHAATVLFQEDFNGITTGYFFDNCGGACSHYIQTGVPMATGSGTTINGGADNDWYAARFQSPSNGTILSDVGAQQVGGATGSGASYVNNPTPVGMFQDDAGLLFKISTTGYTNITLTFDWRTFVAETTDKVTVGYFVGDLDASHPSNFAANRTIDLRPTSQGGPANGPGNWSNYGGSWVQLMSGSGNDLWHLNQSFNLTNANNAPEVWVAFWLNDGESDVGKVDNVVIMADQVVVPLPAAVWLFGSGLLGLVGVAQRKRNKK